MNFIIQSSIYLHVYGRNDVCATSNWANIILFVLAKVKQVDWLVQTSDPENDRNVNCTKSVDSQKASFLPPCGNHC